MNTPFNKPASACATCGQGYTGKRCPKCGPSEASRVNNSYESKSKDPWHKHYRSKRWLELRQARLRGNPLCQLILYNGKQCTNLAVFGHHLISPRVGGEAAMYNAKNIVTLCRCHHDDRVGEQPNDPRNFADSIGFGGEVLCVHPKYPHKSSAQAMALSCNLAGLP